MTRQRIERLRKILHNSRARLMDSHPFFALLLMYTEFVATDSIKKMSTDGRGIYFSPSFLEKLKDCEVDFVLCHQIMHILSGDIARPSDLAGDDYHLACDILINSELEKMDFPVYSFTHLGEVLCSPPGKEIDVTGLTRQKVLSLIPFSLYILNDSARLRYLVDGDDLWGFDIKVPDNGVIILSPPEDDGLLYPKDSLSGAGESDGSSGSQTESLTLTWQMRARDALASQSMSDGKNSSKLNIPQSARELLEHRKASVLNWRKLLNDFLQEEICDYSFSPPDRRFAEYDFFLPDYNEKEFVSKNVLFMVDTSGSVSVKDLTDAFDEIQGAIEQFKGKLLASIGFFDTAVTPPIPFYSISSLKGIIPYGGGGTDFDIIFDYIFNVYEESAPACIIILTDGYANFPPEDAANGIPVLWLINNEEITPPWGKLARFIKD